MNDTSKNRITFNSLAYAAGDICLVPAGAITGMMRGAIAFGIITLPAHGVGVGIGAIFGLPMGAFAAVEGRKKAWRKREINAARLGEPKPAV